MGKVRDQLSKLAVQFECEHEEEYAFRAFDALASILDILDDFENVNGPLSLAREVRKAISAELDYIDDEGDE